MIIHQAHIVFVHSCAEGCVYPAWASVSARGAPGSPQLSAPAAVWTLPAETQYHSDSCRVRQKHTRVNLYDGILALSFTDHAPWIHSWRDKLTCYVGVRCPLQAAAVEEPAGHDGYRGWVAGIPAGPSRDRRPTQIPGLRCWWGLEAVTQTSAGTEFIWLTAVWLLHRFGWYQRWEKSWSCC